MSPNHSGFEKWKSNTNSDAVPVYQRVIMWNLTNVDEVKKGGRPIYNEGPECAYRKFYNKTNVNFEDDGNLVSYQKFLWYVLDNSASSPGCTLDTLITNLNPAYVGILARAGGEEKLALSLISPTLSAFFNPLLASTFPQFVLYSTTSSVSYSLFGALLSIVKNGTEDPLPRFCQIWLNETTIPSQGSQQWTQFGLVSVSNPSEISPASCFLLVNQSLPISFFNPASFQLWATASAGDPQAKAKIGQLFSLNTTQVDLVVQWRVNFFIQNAITKSVLAKFGVSTPAELGWLQWSQGVVLGGNSVNDVLQLKLPGPPEFFIWQKNVANISTPLVFSISQSQSVLNGSAPLFSTQYLAIFLRLVSTGNFTGIQAIWGLDPNSAVLVAKYLLYIENAFVDSTLKDLASRGGGLFVTRTIDEWLWTGRDPLLKFLGLPDKVSLQTNNSLPKLPDTFHTGKDNIDLVSQYYSFQNQTVLCGRAVCGSGIWRDNVLVQGGDGTQFSPNVEKSDALILFSSDVLRPIVFDFLDEVDVKDIHLWRYVIPSAVFEPNDTYYQSIYGFANMTSSFNMPIFISKPNFYGINSTYVDKIGGLVQNASEDETFIDVEPVTGAVFVAEKRLQLNVYVPSNETGIIFDRYNKLVPNDIFFPIFWGSESAIITDNLADKFRNRVYLIRFLEPLIFWTCLIAGPAFLVLGFVIIFIVLIAVRNNKKLGYQTVA